MALVCTVSEMMEGMNRWNLSEVLKRKSLDKAGSRKGDCAPLLTLRKVQPQWDSANTKPAATFQRPKKMKLHCTHLRYPGYILKFASLLP
jgi:hypothetical protein